VPEGADQLYLGFADAWAWDGDMWGGNPGFYDDDIGNLTASFTISPTPEPGSAALVLLGFTLVARLRKRLRGTPNQPTI
jgi:hypothetical protein